MNKIDERKPCIYKATSKTTGLSYIGQTKDGLNKRKSRHKSQAYKQFSKTKFHKSVRQLGWEDFEWSILKIVESKSRIDLQDQLNLFEKAFIKEYDSFHNGYNSDEGGTGGIRYKYKTLEEKRVFNRIGLRLRRDAKREEVNKRLRERRAMNPEKWRNRVREKRQNDPELVERMRERHREYMKQNQQKRRSLKRDQINARQNAKRAENREAYRIAFNERRRKRKENKLNSSN